jgi:hypothetical protein
MECQIYEEKDSSLMVAYFLLFLLKIILIWTYHYLMIDDFYFLA